MHDTGSNFEPDNLLIVGAGASFNAGLPLASQFTQELTNLSRLNKSGPSAAQVNFLKKFISDTFSNGEEIPADKWPELEDVFTLIDLAANTGHNLGQNYSAGKLRIVRRALLVRMIRMFSQRYSRAKRRKDWKWLQLEQLMAKFDHSSTAVLSMNWDTTFEQGLSRTQGIEDVEYGCGAVAANFEDKSLKTRATKGDSFHIVKPHGSVNWLYCDNCRTTFWVDGTHYNQVAQIVSKSTDWTQIGSAIRAEKRKSFDPECPRCSAKSLGTRFATFSYKKALDFPMLTSSWVSGEQRLTETTNWVFFGYSMPAADFEFKAMLKRVQLSASIKPKISIITGGDDAKITVQRFKQFFGNNVSNDRCFLNGLDDSALSHLEKIGVMKTEI